MKVKNIIIGMLVAIGALTSCTSEEPIEPQVNNGDLSIVFSEKHLFLNHITKIQPPPSSLRNVAEQRGKRGRRGAKRGKPGKAGKYAWL